MYIINIAYMYTYIYILTVYIYIIPVFIYIYIYIFISVCHHFVLNHYIDVSGEASGKRKIQAGFIC